MFHIKSIFQLIISNINFSEDSVCVLCKENDDRLLAKLTQKGCNTLIARSKTKGIIQRSFFLNYW